jgi:hypothetical protein
MPRNFFQNIKNAASTGKKALTDAGFVINDDRGNALNVPINQQKPKGIYRTFLPSGNVSNVMVKVDKNGNDNNPPGFTPEEYYYMNGTQSISDITGLSKEQGNVQTNASLKNNTGLNKISRTNMSWTPANASPQNGQHGNSSISFLTDLVPPGIYGPSGGNNVYGNSKITDGFTNPFFYINNPDLKKGVPGNPTTGLPDEFGTYPNDIKPNFNKNKNYLINTDPDTMLKGNGSSLYGAEEVFNFFSNDEQYSFVHNLDRSIPITGLMYPSAFKDVHLASFLSKSDNEDPTMFGYDISINFASSPLFNGSIIDFINSFSPIPEEMESRRDVWLSFCKQFFKFFKVDQNQRLNNYTKERFNPNYGKNPAETNSSQEIKKQTGQYDEKRDSEDYGTGDFGKKNYEGKQLESVTVTAPLSQTRRQAGISTAKTYYLKKISGLENLVEKDVSSNSDTIKSMIDYGKDIIKLSLYEDVSVNTGYLAALYKSLSWSRLNGKQIIPENLLRFDAKITITEIRDYNKVVKDYYSDELVVSPDLLTKYTYTLYDCQFMFNEMSHGGEIDMSSPKLVDDFEISFNYKYSTLSFDKFYISGTTQSLGSKFSINNKNIDVMKISSVDADGSITVDGSIQNIKNPIELKEYMRYTKYRNHPNIEPAHPISQLDFNYKNNLSNLANKWPNFINSESNLLSKAKSNDLNKQLLNNLGKKLKKAAANEINRQITTQAKLLNRTLDNIRNSIGIGRMSEPTNVYKTNQLKNDVQNAFREFVGNSVRGFFTP